MISDELQDQAALFILDALSPEEQAAFERTLVAEPELRAIVHELREAAADLGRSAPAHVPPASVKASVLREIALEKQGSSLPRSSSSSANWLPWAIAAVFLLFCGVLAVDRSRLQRELANVHAIDPLAQATLIALVSPNGEHPDARVAVAWQWERQSGVITIDKMPPPEPGQDYQLWAICANRKDPVNAGVVHVDPSGIARIHFKPSEEVAQIKAFAISLERAGGAPKREGPIVMIGNG